MTEIRNVQLKIDEVFAEKLPADDSVRLLEKIMEEMEYSPLMRAYKRTGRRSNKPRHNAENSGICHDGRDTYQPCSTSTCCQDINFIWLLNGEKLRITVR